MAGSPLHRAKHLLLARRGKLIIVAMNRIVKKKVCHSSVTVVNPMSESVADFGRESCSAFGFPNNPLRTVLLLDQLAISGKLS
jgi:hypothetical protein